MKELHNLSQMIPQQTHSAMISSHGILSNQRVDTWLDEIDCKVDLEESVKLASW